MKNLKIRIEQPCQANWDKMTPNEYGKFCDECQLTVVDFSNMSEHEIKDYFMFNYGQKTCGYFKTNQLAEDSLGSGSFWRKLLLSIENKLQPTLKTTILAGITILAIITGCRRPVSHPIMGKVAVQPQDRDIMTMGEPRFTPEQKADSLKIIPPTKMGKIKAK